MGQYQIPEVCVFFCNSLMRGNRVIFIEENPMSPYISANYPDIGKYNNFGIDIDWKLTLNLPENLAEELVTYKKIYKNVIHLEKCR